MAKTGTTDLGNFLSQIRDDARSEVLDKLRPHLEAINEILSGESRATKRRAGRPKKRAGARQKGQTTARGRAPRGALEAAVREALNGSSPKRLNEIRDAVAKDRVFRNSNKKGLYSQIAQKLNKMDAVKKTKDGYVLKG